MKPRKQIDTRNFSDSRPIKQREGTIKKNSRPRTSQNQHFPPSLLRPLEEIDERQILRILIQTRGELGGFGNRQRAGEIPADVGRRLPLDGPQPREDLVAAVQGAGAAAPPVRVRHRQDPSRKEPGPDDVQQRLGLVVVPLTRDENLQADRPGCLGIGATTPLTSVSFQNFYGCSSLRAIQHTKSPADWTAV